MLFLSFPLVSPSKKNEYACPDGEVASAINVEIGNPDLVFSSSEPWSAFTSLPFSPAYSFDVPVIRLSDDNTATDYSDLSPALVPAILPGWHSSPAMLPSKIMERNPESADEAGWGRRVMDLLSEFRTLCASRRLHAEPMVVLPLLTFDDGRLQLLSPTLISPATNPPVVEGSADYSVSSMLLTLHTGVYRLECEPVAIAASSSVSNITLYVSDPLPLYDRKTPPTVFHHYQYEGATLLRAWIPGAVEPWDIDSALRRLSGNRSGSSSGSGSGLKPYMLTRALKLGDPERRKRIMAVSLRCIFSSAEGDAATLQKGVRLTLFGSDNLTEWHTICSGSGLSLQGIWTSGFRFHRVAAEFPAPCRPQALAIKYK